MPNSTRITFLFNLYLQKKLTEKEFEEFFDLVKQNSAEGKLNTDLYNLWNTVDSTKTNYEPNWNQLYENVTGNEARQGKIAPIKRVKKSWYFAAAAAVFIGVFSVFVSIYNNHQYAVSNLITYTVPYKSVKKIKLADGSQVILNAGTTIKYPQNFTGKTREVSIDGEGYFQVVHLKDKPFVVHSGKLQTQVLGTTFNINSYSKSSNLQVTVVSGKVAVKEALSGKQFMLVANQQAALNKNMHTFKKLCVADAENTIAWRDGKLIFEDTSLEEIATQLSLKYGVKTTLSSNNLKNCRISAVFYHKPLTEILFAITQLTHTNYTIQNNRVIIFGKGCNS